MKIIEYHPGMYNEPKQLIPCPVCKMWFWKSLYDMVSERKQCSNVVFYCSDTCKNTVVVLA